MTKLRRARTLALALAILLTRGGERVGALGSAPRSGPRGPERLALDLLRPMSDVEAPAKSAIVFFSDFYAPIETWRERLSASASAGATGALVTIADPAEEDFPFQGRTLFREPGGKREALIGRAEHARELYAERLQAQRRDIRELGAKFGFPSLTHRTDHAAGPVLALLIALVSERFA